MPTVQTIKDNGHRLINFNDAYFYYVLTYPGWAYSTKPTVEKIYNEWVPGKFPSISSTQQQILPNDDASLLGASFAIWADKPAVETEQQVATGIKHLLRAMATRSWNATSKAASRSGPRSRRRLGCSGARTSRRALLDLTLTGEPTGEVDKGAVQSWQSAVANKGDTSSRATVSIDLSELAKGRRHRRHCGHDRRRRRPASWQARRQRRQGRHHARLRSGSPRQVGSRRCRGWRSELALLVQRV